MASENLTWAVRQWEGNKRYNQLLAEKYYEGNHRLAFATEKFTSTFGMLFKEFAENMCPAVVDSLSDRLTVTGFKTSASANKEETIPAAAEGLPERKIIKVEDPLGVQAWDLWRDQNMELISSEVHKEAVKTGNAYVIVWPGPDMYPQMFFNYGTDCAVQYDPNVQGQVLRGCKTWFNEVDKHWYLNVYLPTHIEKYRSVGTPSYFEDRESSWVQVGAVPNPYGEVPIFHFSNGELFRTGRSRLKDAIPLQDGLNKSVMDLLVAMEFAAFKQRYVIGIDPEIDEATGEPVDAAARNYGVDRMMAIANEDAKVGQFDATDLGQFLRVQEKFWSATARVTGTPLHYFLITTGDFPSGEAMKSAEARFTKEIADNQVAFGTIWERVMLFAMKIQGSVPEDLRIDPLWKDASPRSESEVADTAVKKKSVGVSTTQILKELGYDDETIERMMEENLADQASKMMQAMKEAEASKPEVPPPGPGSKTPPSGTKAQPSGQNTRGVKS